jgi:hypothetical protein
MTFQPESIASSLNRMSVRLSRLGGSPDAAKLLVAVALSSVCARMKEPSAFNV